MMESKLKLWRILDWNATEVHVQDVSHLIPTVPTHDEPVRRPCDIERLAKLQIAREERLRLGIKLKTGRPRKIQN